MVTVVLNTQVLILAAVLLAACLAKLTIREPAETAPDHVHGVPVPAKLSRATALRQSRQVNVGLGLTEGLLALGLLVTSHFSVRLATTVTFAAATWVVGELRVHRPDAGCGCFGGLSTKRVGRRSVIRAVLFTAAAVASLGAPHAGLTVLAGVEAQVILVLAVELALFAALSPELSALLERRGLRHRPAEPCERRRSPMTETLSRLRDSADWLRYEDSLVSATPLDVWRERCWRFLTYSARIDDQHVEIVFAVSTAARDHTVRSAMTPPAGDTAATEAPASGTPALRGLNEPGPSKHVCDRPATPSTSTERSASGTTGTHARTTAQHPLPPRTATPQAPTLQAPDVPGHQVSAPGTTVGRHPSHTHTTDALTSDAHSPKAQPTTAQANNRHASGKHQPAAQASDRHQPHAQADRAQASGGHQPDAQAGGGGLPDAQAGGARLPGGGRGAEVRAGDGRKALRGGGKWGWGGRVRKEEAGAWEVVDVDVTVPDLGVCVGAVCESGPESVDVTAPDLGDVDITAPDTRVLGWPL
ncbi:MauE/DoxX family redox-associated membrane protein [Spirillospora sp. NPDC047279]|uniref:MauE/DoxX family redox-associated membrane protein n=1 Tax=Spirillospora sp. NPDC047279 TaxID=3155478 RepID=UPI0033E6DD7A